MKPYQHHILFCTGGDCKKEGNKKALKRMKKALKKSKQPFVKCTEVKCLGACKHAPIMVVYPHGTWYHGVTSKDQLQAIIDEQIDNGKTADKNVLHQMKSPVVTS